MSSTIARTSSFDGEVAAYHGEGAAVDVQRHRGEDAVGEAPLLPHLLEQSAGGAAAEDVVGDRHRPRSGSSWSRRCQPRARWACSTGWRTTTSATGGPDGALRAGSPPWPRPRRPRRGGRRRRRGRRRRQRRSPGCEAGTSVRGTWRCRRGHRFDRCLRTEHLSTQRVSRGRASARRVWATSSGLSSAAASSSRMTSRSASTSSGEAPVRTAPPPAW